jgi:uncharacterized flavoprotein (TIGR03862 family)
LLKKGFKVELYDHSSAFGKKFLVAGNGGLNLTHSEELSSFTEKYNPHEKLFGEMINEFSPEDLRGFCKELGVETFIGSSGRIFPKKLKAAEILISWLKSLKENPNFSQHLGHHFNSLLNSNKVEFLVEKKPLEVEADFFIFAMGGASWSKTGSKGDWAPSFIEAGIKLAPFLPMNCGFERSWSELFIKKIDHTALKNIALEFKGVKVRGEAMLTPFGIEGGGIYALSKAIRDEILNKGSAEVLLDLKPGLSRDEIEKKINAQPAKASLSNIVRKALGFDPAVFILLKELHPGLKKEEVSEVVKELRLELIGIRPIDEAISTSGGVLFSEVSSSLELKSRPGNYIIGEMLDFEAPTGGYLLQGCFSSAYRAVAAIGLHT